ncbi:putative bifunctional UDP-N-acetylglucosamine transferase and deubiquitinase ALG13 isoform X2 [Engraulis encrasicolus]|uniref:putative bifunctional UDP-N-acetylglucosamine transferase and deubiquitinase ALG13 isoform X2 n=1 Tax=Engraulis encrasicolus TaxID=184585 RepID=UPI002FD1E33A
MKNSLRKYFANMDEYFARNGLYRKMVARDASCLFRAVSEQLYYTQFYHQQVRTDCVNFMRSNKSIFETYVEGSFEKYLERLEDPMETAGQVEIKALSLLHRRCFVIYRFPGGPPTEIKQDGFEDKILLCYSNSKHYDIVYPKTYVPAARACQTLLYELLYTAVFGVDPKDVQAAMEVWNDRRRRNSHSMCSDEGGYDMSDERREEWDIDGNCFIEDDVRIENESKATEEPATFTISYQVLKSLDPNTYRNVEYDMWHFMRRELRKTDYVVIAGRQYYLGDKCQVRLEPKGRYYNAFIQEVGSKTSVVTVFSEELGERIQVSVTNVKPVNAVPACQVTPLTHGGTSEQYPADQDFEVRGRRRFYRKPRGVASPMPCSRAQSSMGPRFQPAAGNMPLIRPAGFHGGPLPPRMPDCDHYRARPGPRPHRGTGSPRRASRFVNRHPFIEPEVSFYHNAGRRCYQSFENYSFRPRVRRHMQTITKECQFSLVPPGAEEVQDMGGAVAFYDIDKGNQSAFPPLMGQPVARPMMAAAAPYWAPSACGTSTVPGEQPDSTSDEDTDDRSNGEEQGEYSGEYVYTAGDAGFENPAVYTAAESTANLTIQEGGSCSTSAQDGAATYSYSQQVVVKSAVISSSQPVAHPTAEIFPATGSSASSSRASDTPPDPEGAFLTHHGQPPAARPGVAAGMFMPYPWHVNEMAEVVGVAAPPPLSCDPNGNDLPEDYKVLQYYYNIGVQSYLHSMVHANQVYHHHGAENHYQPYHGNMMEHGALESLSDPTTGGHHSQPDSQAPGPPLSLDTPPAAPPGQVLYPLLQDSRSMSMPFLPHVYEPYVAPVASPPPTYHYITTWIPGGHGQQPWPHAHPHHTHTHPHPHPHPIDYGPLPPQHLPRSPHNTHAHLTHHLPPSSV